MRHRLDCHKELVASDKTKSTMKTLVHIGNRAEEKRYWRAPDLLDGAEGRHTVAQGHEEVVQARSVSRGLIDVLISQHCKNAMNGIKSPSHLFNHVDRIADMVQIPNLEVDAEKVAMPVEERGITGRTHTVIISIHQSY